MLRVSQRRPSLLRRNRDFRYLFLAQLMEAGAYWFVQVPVLVLLIELTGNGLWGALSLAISTALKAALLPVAGMILDRSDRRRIMLLAIVVDIVAVSALLLVRSAGTVWFAFFAMAVIASASAFFMPTALVALPNLVRAEDLQTANVIAGSAFGTMSILGASVSGVLIAVFPPYASFAVTIVALMCAILLVSRIRGRFQTERASTNGPPTRPAIIDGFRYIIHRPRVRVLVTVKCAVGLGNGILVIYPLLAASFGNVATGTGLLFAARGAGAVLGPFLQRRVLSNEGWLLPGLAVSMAVFGLSYVAISLAGWFPLVLALVFVAQLAGSGNWAMSSYALQAEVPDEFRGRVVAADVMLSALAVSGSQLVMGALIDSIDSRILLAACGMITLIYAIGWRAATVLGQRQDPDRAIDRSGRFRAG